MNTLKSSKSSKPCSIEYSSYVYSTISDSIARSMNSNALFKSRFTSRYMCNGISCFSLEENNVAISKMKSFKQISMDSGKINSNISGL